MSRRDPARITIEQRGRNYVFRMPYEFLLPDELKGEFNSLHKAQQVLQDYHKAWRKKVEANQSYEVKQNAKRREHIRRVRAAKKAEKQKQETEGTQCGQSENASP